MEKIETKNTNSIFESIKHIDDYGNEFWLERELMMALESKRWDKFCNVIENTKIAYEKSNNIMSYHFFQVGRMVERGSKASRNIMNVKLSRYACYLIDTIYKDEILWLSQKECCNELDKKSVTEKCLLTADD